MNAAEILRAADPMTRVRGIPHWIDRMAAGVLDSPPPPRWLTAAETATLAAARQRIAALRTLRSQRKLQAAPPAAVPRSIKRRLEYLRAAPNPAAPDTLGWRGWDISVDGLLMSPVQRTIWHDRAMRAECWDDSDALRCRAGIHALRMPMDWRRADPGRTEIGWVPVVGVVERFGRYVLGTEGWRAEWVVIRELMAPNEAIAEQLRLNYPDVIVHVRQKEKVS